MYNVMNDKVRNTYVVELEIKWYPQISRQLIEGFTEKNYYLNFFVL